MNILKLKFKKDVVYSTSKLKNSFVLETLKVTIKEKVGNVPTPSGIYNQTIKFNNPVKGDIIDVNTKDGNFWCEVK
jgi:hypothetical protein